MTERRASDPVSASPWSRWQRALVSVPSAWSALLRTRSWLVIAVGAGLVQLAVAVAVMAFAASHADDLLLSVVARPAGGFWRATWTVAWLALVAMALGLGLVVGMGLGGAAASPWYDRLVERVEISEGVPASDAPTTARALVVGVVTAVSHALLYLALWAVMAAAAFALNLVPLLGQVAAAGAGAAVSAFTLALQATDGATSRRNLKFGEKLALARSHAPEWVGLGMGMMALSMVPFANLLAAPAAVVAGTRLVVAIEREREVSQP